MKKEIKTKQKAPAKKARPPKQVKKENLAEQKPKISFGLHNLVVPAGAHKKKKLLGRGPSSGHGKTSTRGSKGQTSRAGRHMYAGFEGGQTPLIRRMPKRGFSPMDKKVYQIVNLETLSKMKDTTINPKILEDRGIIKNKDFPVKILGNGELKNPLNVQAQAFSKSAAAKIIKAGGKIEIIHVIAQ